MSGYTQIPVPDMDTWSTEQILAVYDLCQSICATLMQRHEETLVEKMIESDEQCTPRHPCKDTTLSLPFDEPF